MDDIAINSNTFSGVGREEFYVLIVGNIVIKKKIVLLDLYLRDNIMEYLFTCVVFINNMSE